MGLGIGPARAIMARCDGGGTAVRGGHGTAQGDRHPAFLVGQNCRRYPPTCVFAGWRRPDVLNAQAFPRNQDAADELRGACGSGLCSAPIARASCG